MMKCTCDVCGRAICEAPFGEFSNALRKEARSRNTMRIKSRSEDGTATDYDDVCGECTEGILAYIASRKEYSK